MAGKRADKLNVTDLEWGIYRWLWSGGVTFGKRINSVSIMAEWFFFVRLHAIADDFGNFRADADTLLLQAVPLRREQVTFEQIQGWLNELASTKPKPLLRLYESNGEPCGHIEDFMVRQPAGRNGRRVRRAPEWEGDSKAIQGDPVLSGGVSASDSDSHSDTDTPKAPKGAVQGSDFPGFDRFWAMWPPKHFRKENREGCLKKWRRLGLERLTDVVLDGLERWIRSAEWAKDNGAFIPGPHPWLNRRRWEQQPPPANGGTKSSHGTRTVAMGVHA